MNVFGKYNLNGIEINNRIIRSATHDGLADANGAPTEKSTKLWQKITWGALLPVTQPFPKKGGPTIPLIVYYINYIK